MILPPVIFCLLFLQSQRILGSPSGKEVLILGGRGGTPGETHLTAGIQRKGPHLLPQVPERLLQRKEYREISPPTDKQDFYNNFENEDYDDYASEQKNPQRLLGTGFNAPSDFKSNFGSFDDFFKGFGPNNKGFANFLNTVNLNSFRGSGGLGQGFSHPVKEPSYESDDFYDDYEEEKPKFTRPEPVYVPQEESKEEEAFGEFQKGNAGFRYKEESLYPEFQEESFGGFHEPQRETQEHHFNEYAEGPSNQGFQEFQDTLKQEQSIGPQDFQEQQPQFDHFDASPAYPEHHYRPSQLNSQHPPRERPQYAEGGGHSSPSQEEELVIFNPNNIKQKPIIRPIKTKEPVYSNSNFRRPVKPLPTNVHESHQLIRIPSIDDRFRPIIQDSPREFTEFDDSQEIITAPPFPKQRFVNSQASQTFDVKLGAGFNTRDGVALDSKVFKPINHFSNK